MLNEKKTDYNSIIGIILIAGLLTYFMVSNQPEKQPTPTTPTASQTTPEGVAPATAPVVDSVQLAIQEQTQTFTLENEQVQITFSNMGAQPTRVLVKGYTDYRGEPLYLMDGDNARLSMDIPVGNSVVQTHGRLFATQTETTDQGESLIFSLPLADGKLLQYIYTLDRVGYMLHMQTKTQGLDSDLLGRDALFMKIDLKGIRHEKSANNEDRYSELNYMYEQDKTDYLSLSGSDQENEPEVKWVAFKQQFFSTVLIHPSGYFPQANLSTLALNGDPSYSRQYTATLPMSITNNSLNSAVDLYFGPNDYHTLKGYDNTIEDLLPLGWGIFGWINKYFVIPIFDWLFDAGLNIALVILLLTLIVKLILSPITYKNYVSSAKMKILKPDLEALNAKMKDADAAQKQQATMQLYQKAGVNPLAGCIPALLQMPILIAMFRFFPQAIQLRQVPFLWADDLSSYDSIFDFGFSVPLYGDHVSLLTILLAGSTFLYTRVTGNTATAQPTQPGMPNMKVIMYIMPFMMIFWFNDFASGLSLYYFIANVTTILQVYVIRKYILDESKIRAKIQKNKERKGKAPSKLQQRMEQLMNEKQKQKQLKNKRKKK